ncbi:hypothetical protein RHS04_08275 [Rhizoctonia solani]|uniref:F-box domain-containing protein n=1 Tax=Rhizoctonia solani TaxID=456999 RepID=A0A8H7H3F8_9AGAM|nr:hypothetical protein RHS04_08275 [Rhizoctonia solani]
MITAVSQLEIAHDSLLTALNHYLSVCSSINKSQVYSASPQGNFQELIGCVSNELALIPDLEKILLKARATLASTRNCAPCIAPVSRLPDDILIQIFQFITDDRGCNAYDDGRARACSPFRYPRLLTHVCSHWRDVALTSKSLWVHIDIPSYISCTEGAIANVKECISQAGARPLDIHLVEPDIDTRPPPTIANLSHIPQILEPISPQVRSLEFRLGKPLRSLQCPESSAKRYSHLLSAVLKNATLGSLTRLAISLENTLPGSTSQHYFMEGNGGDEDHSGGSLASRGNIASISVSQSDLEALLLSVISLELKGIYPRWTSQAYRGLVELRLNTYNGVSMPETSLRAILSSSPGLRRLDFGLKITRTPLDLDYPPVLLSELETLVTGQRGLEELGLFLRMINPGSRPLAVYLDKPGRCSSHPDIPRVPFNSHIEAFFARTNVERLSIAGTYNYSQVIELLGLVPRARMLLLNGLCLGNIKSNACMEFSGPHLSLESFYLLNGAVIAQHFLASLIQWHRIQRFIVAEDSKVIGPDSLDLEKNLPFKDVASHPEFTVALIPQGGRYPMEL